MDKKKDSRVIMKVITKYLNLLRENNHEEE